MLTLAKGDRSLILSLLGTVGMRFVLFKASSVRLENIHEALRLCDNVTSLSSVIYGSFILVW